MEQKKRSTSEQSAASDSVHKGEVLVGDSAVFHHDAQRAWEQERSLTLLQGVRLYPKAILWSFFFSLGIIMTAFDPQLMVSPNGL